MTIIDTRLGRIACRNENGVNIFLGIPFAAPPVAALRWQPPQPAASWSGVFDATVHGNQCLQPPTQTVVDLGETPGAQSEDCLYLNVYTPANDAGARPVIVWIHGGAYIQGSANQFDGSTLARDNDVVVVAINYRLGVFGFLDLGQSFEGYGGCVALGIQDHIAALAWVRDNISDYGGDPGNVTVSGESAGGASVFALLGAPAAQGLFHKAISFSAAEQVMPMPDPIPALAEHLGQSDAALLDQLMAMSAEDLLALQVQGVARPGACIDGDVVTQTPASAYANGCAIPLIAGCNKDDGSFLAPAVAEVSGGADDVMDGFAAQIGAGDPDRYFAYLDATMPDATPVQRFERIWYDYFRASTLRAAEAATTAGPGGWVYNFDVPTDHPFGTAHGSDIPFTFNSFKRDPDHWSFHDASDPVIRDIAEKWSATIATFARTGDPNGAGLPQWPRYDTRSRRCLQLTRSAQVLDNPDAAALQAYGIN